MRSLKSALLSSARLYGLPPSSPSHMAGIAQSNMSPCSAVELYSKAHTKKGCGDQARRLAAVDINPIGKTAAKLINRLAAAKCPPRKRGNIGKISEKSREMSAISCALRRLQILQDELSITEKMAHPTVCFQLTRLYRPYDRPQRQLIAQCGSLLV
jgi:hypothetical protein